MFVPCACIFRVTITLGSILAVVGLVVFQMYVSLHASKNLAGYSWRRADGLLPQKVAMWSLLNAAGLLPRMTILLPDSEFASFKRERATVHSGSIASDRTRLYDVLVHLDHMGVVAVEEFSKRARRTDQPKGDKAPAEAETAAAAAPAVAVVCADLLKSYEILDSPDTAMFLWTKAGFGALSAESKKRLGLRLIINSEMICGFATCPVSELFRLWTDLCAPKTPHSALAIVEAFTEKLKISQAQPQRQPTYE